MLFLSTVHAVLPQLRQLLRGPVAGLRRSNDSAQHRGDDGRLDQVLVRRVPAATHLHARGHQSHRGAHPGKLFSSCVMSLA